MVLITGGAASGKRLFAEGLKSSFPNKKIKIVSDYPEKVISDLQNGLAPLEEVKKYLAAFNDELELFVITREVGSGVIPVDGFERLWREEAGRVNCFLASAADEVYLMNCGIGRKIK